MTGQIDILRDAWIPTDKGVLSPVDALRYASRPTWARGDWNAATVMFLHALVQTAVVLSEKCPDRKAWLGMLDSPPSDFLSWFNGLDAGPSPWQCCTAVGEVPVASILPETPGENALKKSSDIMRWQQQAPTSLSLYEAQIAIISDQFWGIPGGRGHREGCRGRRPMTTMVEPASIDSRLWEKIWLNIFPKDAWQGLYGSDVPFEFPWKKPLPTGQVTPANAHSLEMLWQMPRRWRIKVDPDGRVSRLLLQGDGREYVGWIHPLTGLFLTAKNEWVKTKINPHIGFRDWSAIAVGISEKARVPAVVNRYLQDRKWRGSPIRLRCFGWALGDADAVGAWVDLVVPLYVEVDHVQLEEAVATAEKVRSALAGRLKGIQKYLANDANKLYQALEADFYRRVSATDWDGWELALRRQARNIFWEIATLHRYDMYKTAEAAATL